MANKKEEIELTKVLVYLFKKKLIKSPTKYATTKYALNNLKVGVMKIINYDERVGGAMTEERSDDANNSQEAGGKK